jgi:signal transduction histidine kinase
VTRRNAALAVIVLCFVLSELRLASSQTAPLAGPPLTPGNHAPPREQNAPRRVLLLYSEPRLTPALVAVDGTIRSRLESRSPGPINFYTEYLDLALFREGVPLPELHELLRRKYGARALDLIVAAGSAALRIALQNRVAFFSGAPVVFVSVDQTAASDLSLDADVTGTWLRQGWAETLELARRLQPDLRRIVVINGSSAVDRVWAGAARRQIPASGPVEATHLVDLPFDGLLDAVKALPRHTAVLMGVFLRDAAGRDFRTPEAVRRVAAAASAPVYVLTDTGLDTGAVGGVIVNFERHGRVAADLALRVLAGERPSPTDVGTNVPTVDVRQLARWGLDVRRLPAGSVLLFEEPSLWARYRWYIVGAAAVVLLQSGLIAGLLVHRAQRRRAQRILADRLRFETLVSNLSSRFAASSALDAEEAIQSDLPLVGEGLGVDWATVRVMEVTAAGARLARAWTRAGVAPRPSVIREDQTPWIFGRIRQAHTVRITRLDDLPPEAATDRQHLQALDLRSAVVLPLVSGSAVLGFLSVGMTQTERAWPNDLVAQLQLLAEVFAHALERRRSGLAARESETRIRDLAGRLMTAQEEERRRIARDLHDDVNQELAALSISLSRLGERLPAGAASDLGADLAQLEARTVALSESIRHLSHELHPGVLQHVGLVAALRGYCRGFAREHRLRVTFRGEGDLGRVPTDVALCLYRVVQEGLGNVAKHAEATEVRVTLMGRAEDVALSVADDGAGFDPREARSRRGLGLLSLDERVRLVGGRLTVDAQPLRGTELQIVVPLTGG